MLDANLRDRFDYFFVVFESVAGWKTARVRRHVLILGSLDGIETGIRQLRSPDLSPKGHATFPPKVTLPFAQRSRYLSPKGHLTLREDSSPFGP